MNSVSAAAAAAACKAFAVRGVGHPSLPPVKPCVEPTGDSNGGDVNGEVVLDLAANHDNGAASAAAAAAAAASAAADEHHIDGDGCSMVAEEPRTPSPVKRKWVAGRHVGGREREREGESLKREEGLSASPGGQSLLSGLSSTFRLTPSTSNASPLWGLAGLKNTSLVGAETMSDAKSIKKKLEETHRMLAVLRRTVGGSVPGQQLQQLHQQQQQYHPSPTRPRRSHPLCASMSSIASSLSEFDISDSENEIEDAPPLSHRDNRDLVCGLPEPPSPKPIHAPHLTVPPLPLPPEFPSSPPHTPLGKGKIRGAIGGNGGRVKAKRVVGVVASTRLESVPESPELRMMSMTDGGEGEGEGEGGVEPRVRDGSSQTGDELAADGVAEIIAPNKLPPLPLADKQHQTQTVESYQSLQYHLAYALNQVYVLSHALDEATEILNDVRATQQQGAAGGGGGGVQLPHHIPVNIPIATAYPQWAPTSLANSLLTPQSIAQIDHSTHRWSTLLAGARSYLREFSPAPEQHTNTQEAGGRGDGESDAAVVVATRPAGGQQSEGGATSPPLASLV
ncbi:unnamed protein product [Vitrella brassicaformis CCMP3155]|uniref:Uncharacterized protein n=3 Tax=Vitrella brassicaformis TaxID=1169539 RepID=A0A0G4F5Y1_VITBC|nr:unnamed protein product [Vitrella brassicaformis CCMP3155]|eukprot:CEM07422.1 unnamed protein product [Vitrella brassicaformis CCMP3155]